MRKLSVILSLLVALSMLLAACGTPAATEVAPVEEAPVAVAEEVKEETKTDEAK